MKKLIFYLFAGRRFRLCWCLGWYGASVTGKRVYIIAPGGALARGGMGRMAAHLTDRLAADRALAIATIDTYGRRVNEAKAQYLMPFFFFRAVMQLFVACAARRIALAHVQMAAYGSVYRKSVMMLICRVFRVPVVLHIHGGDLDRFCDQLDAARLNVLRWIVGGVSEVIVLGEYWREFTVSKLAMPRERVTVVYNAVPRPVLPADKRPRDVCELLFLGMVWKEKGIDELLGALSLPCMSAANWRLTIAGIGDIAHYQGRARQLGIADRIAFVGWTDGSAKERLLERADILVLPSHFECFPMAIIEGMAYGLAIVVTPVGSVQEAITDGETGVIVPVGDSESLGQAVRRLIDDPMLRRRLGRHARTRFCQAFDLDIFERRIRSIYRKHMIAG
jgi:glycosyltransferase involved in cell wall biosynthesis